MLHSVPDKRQQILEAAAELIVANGLQCSMAAIAETAGMATGSIYNYFDSKAGLVQGLYAEVGEQMAQAVIVEHAPDTPPARKVQRYIDDYISFILADPRRQRLFEYLDNAPELNRDSIAAAFSSFLTYSIDLFAQAQAAGTLRAGSPYLLGSFVRGAIRHSIKRRRMVDAAPIDEAERATIAEMCWRAVALD